MTSRRPFPRRLRRSVTALLTALAVVLGVAAAVPASALPASPGDVAAPTAPPGEGSGGPDGPGGTPTSPVTVAPDPSVPRPAVPAGLPTALEELSPYLKQVSCDPTAKPGAIALGKLLVATYPGTSYGVARACGADGIASEHYEGRAVDWMVSVRDPEDAARATALIDWLLAPDAAGNPAANARRLGIMYLIWNDRIWGSYANAAGWRAYSSCATHTEPGWDTSCHRDHVHISLSWAGAMGSTSFWTKKPAPVDFGPCRPADLNWAAPRSGANLSPCPAYPAVVAPDGAPSALSALVRYSGATVGQGASGPVVRAVQAGLGVTADGQFGAGTAAAVSDFRRSQKLAAGTRVDAPTWRALLKVAVAAMPKPADDEPQGAEPTATEGKGQTPAAGRSTARSTALTPYKNLVLTPGSTGPAVSAVQRALKVSPVSGWFGPATKAAVVAFQKAHGIPQTGNVGPLTWKALGA